MASPVVYLIGAGPGDPGLITVKGLECVAKADVVVYDYLANPRFLAAARPDAELDLRRQEGLLRSTSRRTRSTRSSSRRRSRTAGKVVARLKGGDPFIFGRGGEEALALHDDGRRVRGRAGRQQRLRGSRVRRHPGHASRHHHRHGVRHRPRGPHQGDVATSTGRSSPRPSAPSASSWASRTCPTIVENLVEYGRPADHAGRARALGDHAAPGGADGHAGGHRREGRGREVQGAGDHRRRRGREAARAARVVRGQAAVRQDGRRHALARAGERAHRQARRRSAPRCSSSRRSAIVDPESLAAARRGDPQRSTCTDWVVFTSVNGVEQVLRAARRERARRPRARAREGRRDRPRHRGALHGAAASRPDYVPERVPRGGRARGLLRARRGRGHARAHPAGARGARGAAGHAARARRASSTSCPRTAPCSAPARAACSAAGRGHRRRGDVHVVLDGEELREARRGHGPCCRHGGRAGGVDRPDHVGHGPRPRPDGRRRGGGVHDPRPRGGRAASITARPASGGDGQRTKAPCRRRDDRKGPRRR